MGRLNHRLVSVALGAAMVLSGAARAQTPADERGDIALGRELALTICSACHVVAAKQSPPPIRRDPAPSFAAIANRQGVTAATLTQFVTTTHETVKNPYAMPNPQLVAYQVGPLVSYILSLRGQTFAAPAVPAAPQPASDPLYDRVLNQSRAPTPRTIDASQ